MPTGQGKTLIYQIAVLVARTGNAKILPSNALFVVVSPLNALISDQLEFCRRLKLKDVKMEQELFDNYDKLTELEEAEVVYVLQTSRDGSEHAQQSHFRPMAEVSFLHSATTRKRASASRESAIGFTRITVVC